MLLEEVNILIAIAETKSLSQAASRLYLSRPGLSQKLARIEEHYGVELYHRSPAGIELTSAGQIFAKFAYSVAALEKKLEAELAASKESFNSTIDVGMSFADGEALLPQLVKQFHDFYPEEYIHLDAGYETELIEKLKNGDIDFAILENPSIEDGVSRITLGYKRLVFLAPNMPPYNKAHQPVPVKTLFNWPCVSYERESGFHLIGNRFFRERYDLALRSEELVVQFDTWESRIAGVRAGLGWAAMPEVVAKRHRNDPDFIVLKLESPTIYYPVELVWMTDRAISTQAMLFKQFIQENIPEGYFAVRNP